MNEAPEHIPDHIVPLHGRWGCEEDELWLKRARAQSNKNWKESIEVHEINYYDNNINDKILGNCEWLCWGQGTYLVKFVE